ncbi:DUF799 domain-containing protein [Thauera sp.]|uniref:DUF799 domain-containing protein n=1 Tax=unclassified Thauera TaxID=2609274 RepID=UPI002CA08736|nr:DUF799 domain-containing protein [Thauera sp.]HRP26733.1 DUF799 domain-containing protein [Thauera sp.]HRP67826.1 DUF799 domain-containing protein [Thauera sp.]
MRLRILAAAATAAALATGCATPVAYDYSAFKQSRPSSILVLPPLNSSMDVAATYSMLSQVTLPLAESGYYVLPVSLVDETFRQNGLHNPAEMHEVALHKLREIFGADAALYIDIKQYGTSYAVLLSESRVTAAARLIDLRSEQLLWQGEATASSAEDRSSNGGLVGLLVQAIVSQIVESVTNRSHPIAGITSNRLLAAGRPNGILYGPRSPNYQKDGHTQP